MSSDLVHTQREIDNLINLLADARTENMKLRAALLAFADHFGPLEGNPFLHEDALRCFALARAALDYRKMEENRT